jgi:hypothetical protein
MAEDGEGKAKACSNRSVGSRRHALACLIKVCVFGYDGCTRVSRVQDEVHMKVLRVVAINI